MRAALTASRDGAVIIADDCHSNAPQVTAAWRAMVDEGFIVDDFNRTHHLPAPAFLKGWCVGRYRARASDARTLARGFEATDRLRIDPVSNWGYSRGFQGSSTGESR